MFIQCSFDSTKIKLDYCRRKDCKKNFAKDLKKHATIIINYIKKEMVPLIYEENKSHKKQKVCYICKEMFNTDRSDDRRCI